ncbi:transcription-repair coupling factor [Lachnoclostridium sp. An138]|uniref:transcription-repair coupling factor n=1 Tax=Lachnoclostridium sp. An138 TaxID=1965560 RepID=UPI000B399059|nr:transcription-repair coupling factor [Lachnoclostridium sp. An138]OUQ19218.1 transcription-repair coupling factor [Lachnoclostridium sp. An138]
MKAFLEPFQQLGIYEELEKHLKKNRGVLLLSGCVDSQKVHATSSLWQGFPRRVILTYSEQKAREIYEDCRYFDREAVLYQAKDFLFFHADIQGNLLVQQRVRALQALLTKKEVTVITTFDGLMDRLRPLERVKEEILTIGQDSIVEIEALAKKLVRLGYERTGQVEAPGQFAVRGGIVDIFALTEEAPWRIEFWDDEVDSIRSFDAESQRSMENLEEIVIYPAAEPVPGEKEEAVSFLDYFDTEETVFFLDEPTRLLEKGRTVEKEFEESMANRAERGETLPEEARLLYGSEEIVARLNRKNCVALCLMEQKAPEWEVKERYQVEARSVNPYNNSFEMLVKDLKRWKREKYSVILMCASGTRAKRLAADLQEQELNSFYCEDPDRVVNPSEIMVVHGSLHRGYEYPLIRFAVLSETDIFGRERKKRKKKKVYEGQKIQSFSELKPGDYVVHENHGLGIYRGIEKVEVDKVMKDYIKIEYAKGGNLYILATQLEMIQKYAGSDARKPKLNRLGGSEWTRTKSRVRGAVQEVAKDLVQLYAARQQKDGYAYGPDTVWQTEFEELFPFEETADQQLAIEATKKDMESTKIMDRLICGDVGYGKTEIAIRAAFKAVQENKQVVYLVPTTILAQQHYNTFVQRMKDFPVRVDLLCRFRTPAEQKKTIADLKKGFVDIVIGTHRVLSSDVEFKDLGLLIIDEEQRFGVAHKEKIKKLKENIDVLTLTATPIPRTLHMSLIGIRDMSVLEEAPQDRLPIQTYVMEYDSEMVRAAISRELGRGGQVYYVYNRVNNIAEVTAQIAELVPEANVAFAHGQMKEHELEKIMYDFISGEIDVLVSTTIIETGLDISNVNTMIIHDADNLGLSQLYQLRGRVGRSSRTAYAFLMYRKDKMLKEVAEKRLGAIREFTELGSGFKIAMRDLEIRGAGNLLGEQQHGHMQAVGYDLYCKMLNEAVKEEKGTALPEDSFETMVDMELDAYIPDTYIRNESQKLDIYKRIAGIESREECEDMQDELLDRFGDLPRPVQNLLAVADLKVKAHHVYVKELVERPDEIRLVLYEKARLNPAAFPAFIESFGGRMKFVTGEKPALYYRRKKNSRGEETDAMKLLGEILENMQALLEEKG